MKMSGYSQACQLYDLRYAVSPTKKFLDLKDMILHTRSCKATDPRDKVFSVLGLSDPEIYALAPNYRLSLDETLKTAARTMVSRTHCLNLVSGRQTPDRLNGLPSWVPNLTHPWQAVPYNLGPKANYVRLKEENWSFDETGNILRVQGRCFDIIKTICSDFVPQEHPPASTTSVYESWESFTQSTLSEKGLELEKQGSHQRRAPQLAKRSRVARISFCEVI